MLGGEPPAITLVGCEPETTEPGMGLSPAVEGSLDAAAALVKRLIDQQHAQRATHETGGIACSER
jgi:hypothetical protein